MGIVQTDPCQSCRYPMMVARTGLPLFRSAKGRRLRLFLRSRDNSVRETNAQPAPVTGLFTGFGVRPQQAETAVSGNAGNRSFESLWEQRHCLPSSVPPQNPPPLHLRSQPCERWYVERNEEFVHSFNLAGIHLTQDHAVCIVERGVLHRQSRFP